MPMDSMNGAPTYICTVGEKADVQDTILAASASTRQGRTHGGQGHRRPVDDSTMREEAETGGRESRIVGKSQGKVRAPAHIVEFPAHACGVPVHGAECVSY